MADKNLIAGAAALAQSESMLGSALGAGLTQEATRIADDIIKKENERQAQVKNDMNLAAQFIGKMASTGTAAGQYRDILTQEGIKTKNRLNEIALDQSLNAVEKAAEYTKAVDEYNTLAATYGGDQEKLVALQGVVRAGSYSNTIDRDTEEFEIARRLGTGDYKIVKNGYVVNGKKITSAELDQYIQLYKPKNIEAFGKFETQLRNSITGAKGKRDIEDSFVNTALAVPIDQKLNYLVDYKGQAYNNFFQDGEINEDLVKTAFATEMNNLRNESAIAPLVEEKETTAGDIAKSYAQTFLPKGAAGIKQMLNTVLGPEKISGYEIKNNQARFISKFDSDGNPVEYSAIYDLTDKTGLKNTLKKALLASGRYYERDKLKINEAVDLFDFNIEKESTEVGEQDFSEFRRNPLLTNNTFISTSQKTEEPAGMEPFKNPFPTTFNNNQ